jgi:choice-of-anchor B domain-containing protein
LAHHLDLAAIGGGSGSDIWGWTDPETQREYAIMTRSNGTAFVDITDPEEPVYLGNLPSHTGASSVWRDAKTYLHYAYIVSDANIGHGVQVFDLHNLRDVENPPVTFTEAGHYPNVSSTHNIAIDEVSGFAYATGVRNSVPSSNNCAGGLHMINLANPTMPTFAGCYSDDGYFHDAQCVVYSGPDVAHVGKQICFGANATSASDTVTVVDVTNKAAPVRISKSPYAGSAYTHQGWLTPDQRYFLVDDELDESSFGHNTRTYIWNVEDLDVPVLHATYTATVASIDHNLYTRGNFAFLANYRSGLRILDLTDIDSGNVFETAFFDTYPASNSANFNGAWSSYPYFPSGTVIVSDIEGGLFVLRPNLCDPAAPATGLVATAAGPNTIDLNWPSLGPGETVDIQRAVGGCASPDTFATVATGISTSNWTDTAATGQVPVAYRLVRRTNQGLCAAPPGSCAEATTKGSCTAPPSFGGLATATSGGSACVADLSWSPALARCGGPARFDVHRSAAAGFEPSIATRIATAVGGSTWSDYAVNGGESWTYLVRAYDETTGIQDNNHVERTVAIVGALADGTWESGAEIGQPQIGLTIDLAAKHVGWHIDGETAHSGERSWSAHGVAGACQILETPDITLSSGQSSSFSMWGLWAYELGGDGLARDGAVVEISNNNGASWSPLVPVGGYPAVFGVSANDCGLAPGRGTFAGTSTASWTQSTFDLSAYNNGPPVRLRFLASTDLETTLEGWTIDDLAVTHAQVAGTCNPVLFADGFESGSTGGWSAAVP